jgi:hypothetical protein
MLLYHHLSRRKRSNFHVLFFGLCWIWKNLVFICFDSLIHKKIVEPQGNIFRFMILCLNFNFSVKIGMKSDVLKFGFCFFFLFWSQIMNVLDAENFESDENIVRFMILCLKICIFGVKVVCNQVSQFRVRGLF